MERGVQNPLRKKRRFSWCLWRNSSASGALNIDEGAGPKGGGVVTWAGHRAAVSRCERDQKAGGAHRLVDMTRGPYSVRLIRYTGTMDSISTVLTNQSFWVTYVPIVTI